MIKNNNPLNNNPARAQYRRYHPMVTDQQYKKIVTKNLNERAKDIPFTTTRRTIFDIFNIPYSPVDDFLRKLRKKKKLEQIKK